MLVQRILQFIQTLTEFNNITSFDEKLLRELDSYFARHGKENELTPEDFNFIFTCYSKRWKQIFDSDTDHTIDPTGVNEIWIELAREMDSLAGKNFQQI